MSEWKPGDDPCPECGGPATWALDQQGNAIFIVADPGGDLYAEEDANRIHRCRPVPDGTQLAFDDERWSLHACPLAEVIPIARRVRPGPEPTRRYA